MTKKEEQFIEALFYTVCKDTADENPFDTSKLVKIFDDFVEKYINNDIDCESDFSDVVYGYCKQGFIVGYIIAQTLSTPKDLVCVLSD